MKTLSTSNWALLMLLIYLAEFTFLAFDPVSRVIWITENSIGLILAAALVILYFQGVRFSKTAYTLMTLFLCFHTVGGHYTFEKVPFDAITEFFGFERNHYDRICHFMVGFFAYPAMEFFEKQGIIKGRCWAALLMVMMIFGVAAVFELVEWIYAELAAPEAGNAFLGSQGDIWDAQKDMLSDGLGAVFATSLYAALHKKQVQTDPAE
jgi:putative membrane protein